MEENENDDAGYDKDQCRDTIVSQYINEIDGNQQNSNFDQYSLIPYSAQKMKENHKREVSTFKPKLDLLHINDQS